MIVLGIESTAHTFAIAVIDAKNKKNLAHVKMQYTTEKGGIIPQEAAKHHLKIKEDILEETLKKANKKIDEIDLIVFSKSPGIPPCLVVGKDFAKEIAIKNNKPIVGVNHCIGHLEIGDWYGSKDPVMLYASGANTQIIAYESGKYRVFGETLDVGIGNFIDSFAREIGLGFPGGPKIYELSLKGNKLYELPYVVKGMDISFSGILTNVGRIFQKSDKDEQIKANLSYSVQETAFAMLLEVSERALAHLNKKELLLAGGVACNLRFQEMAKKMCDERGCKIIIPEREVLLDNAIMIAWLGFVMYNSNKKFYNNMTLDDKNKIDINSYERTDDVEVTWR